MVWDYLFDNEYSQRSDINELKMAVAAAGDSAEAVPRLRQELGEAKQRIGQMELALEALIRLLEVRSGIGREEVSLMVQRIDLADGVEDGQMGPDRLTEAPACPSCGRPINPKRATCLYCDADVTQAIQANRAPPPRLVQCVRCTAQVPERETFFSEHGVVCPKCFS